MAKTKLDLEDNNKPDYVIYETKPARYLIQRYASKFPTTGFEDYWTDVEACSSLEEAVNLANFKQNNYPDEKFRVVDTSMMKRNY